MRGEVACVTNKVEGGRGLSHKTKCGLLIGQSRVWLSDCSQLLLLVLFE